MSDYSTSVPICLYLYLYLYIFMIHPKALGRNNITHKPRNAKFLPLHTTDKRGSCIKSGRERFKSARRETSLPSVGTVSHIRLASLPNYMPH
jgi:hypothetical protein